MNIEEIKEKKIRIDVDPDFTELIEMLRGMKWDDKEVGIDLRGADETVVNTTYMLVARLIHVLDVAFITKDKFLVGDYDLAILRLFIDKICNTLLDSDIADVSKGKIGRFFKLATEFLEKTNFDD